VTVNQGKLFVSVIAIGRTSFASVGHVDTCGVRFPRLISDAEGFDQPGA